MKSYEVLSELEAVAEKLSVDVRYEELEEGRGGLCKYGGKRRLIIHKRLSAEQKSQIFLRELSKLPLDDVYIVPRIRELIDQKIKEGETSIVDGDS